MVPEAPWLSAKNLCASVCPAASPLQPPPEAWMSRKEIFCKEMMPRAVSRDEVFPILACLLLCQGGGPCEMWCKAEAAFLPQRQKFAMSWCYRSSVFCDIDSKQQWKKSLSVCKTPGWWRRASTWWNHERTATIR